MSDLTRPAPLYEQVAQRLRDEIAHGTYGPGDLLPSEAELSRHYDVSRQTVRQAVAVLRSEGLVNVEHGRGTFVRRPSPLRRVSSARRHTAHRSSGKPIFDTEAIGQGQVPSRQILRVGRMPAPTETAKWLQISPSEEVVARKRLQSLDNEPAVISTSYYPLWIANGTRLESPEPLPEGPDELIETLGHRFSHGIEVFRARMPTHDEVELLKLRPGVPIVQMWHVDYDAENRTLQVADDIYAGDRHEFAFEWSEGDVEQ